MNQARLEQLINAVLYEGYILYPYRPSSKKNRRERFTFGRVYPQAYSAAQGGVEPCLMQTECLVVTASEATTLEVSVRFLQPMAREVGVLAEPVLKWEGAEPGLRPVPELRIGDELYQSWHEAVERRLEALPLRVGQPDGIRQRIPFRFAASRQAEPIRDGDKVVGGLVRRQAAIEGRIDIALQPLDARLFKVTVQIRNETPVSEAEAKEPEELLLRMLASAHTLLQVQGGAFVSLLEPTVECQRAATGCQNIGTWPVLVGGPGSGQRDTMLSSPIILYDYPQIAPESAGPLFDGTEIDELLTLRILTMTEEEKREMRRVDEQARRLLERTEGLGEAARLRMHGTLRGGPSGGPVEFDDFFGASTPLEGVWVQGVYLKPGDRVRIRPKARADIMDLALSGQMASIEAVEQDLEKRVHLALVLENDPGKDLGWLRQPGHRFFFGVEEVEPVRSGEREERGA